MKRTIVIGLLLASMCSAATRNLVPRADGEGGIGTAAKKWGAGYFTALNATTLTADDIMDAAACNITWVPLTDSIEAAINNATAGDTLVLAAGTYTVVDDIDVTKAITILGQGRHGTIITTTTDDKNIFHITASNVGIYNMGITCEASGAHSVLVEGTGGTVLTNVFIESLSIIHTSHAGVQRGIHYIDASGVVKNCLLDLTSTDESVIGVYAENEDTAEAATQLRVLDTVVTAEGGTTPVAAFACQDDSATADCVLDMFFCSTAVTESAACDSGGLYTFGGANAKATAEFCALKATDYDAYNTAGTLTLRNTLLYSNSTSGTITVQGSSQFQAIIADSIDGKGAVDMDYGSADITDHTFETDGGILIIDGSIQFPDADGSPGVVGELQYDNTITGLDDGGFVFYDDDEVQTLIALDSSEVLQAGDDTFVVQYNWNGGAGYFNLVANGGGSVEDDVYGAGWDADTTNAPSQNAVYDYLHLFDTDDDGDFTDELWFPGGGVTAYDDIGDPDASGSISFDAAEGGTYTSAADEWVGITISNTQANLTGDSELLTLAFTDDGDTHSHYLVLSDAAGTQQLEIIQSTADVQITTAGDLKFIAGGGDFNFADDNIATTGTISDGVLTASDGSLTGVVGVDASGTVSANLFTPDAADGADIGTADLEFSDIYLASGSIIKGEDDQSNTITSSATGWTFALDITVSGGNINTGNIPLIVGDATTDTIQLLTDGTGDAEVALPNDSIGDAELNWAGFTDLAAGGEVTWTNLTEGELTDQVIVTGDIKDGTVAFADIDNTITLAGNPTLAASESYFGTTGIIFEGTTADTIEGLLTAADPTTADRTWTLRDASGTILLSGDTLTGDVTATFDTDGSTATAIAIDTIGVDEMANADHGDVAWSGGDADVESMDLGDAGSGTYYVGLFADDTGTSRPIYADGGLTYAQATATLSATTFDGALSGNATTATTAGAGDAAVDFFGAGVDAVTDATECTDIEGTKLSITGGTLNCTETDSVVGAVTGIVKADGGGNISAAVAGTDYEAALTDKASLESTLSDVANVAEADGDVFTGDHDFGGADLELPQGQTPDTDGDIDLDFTDGSVVIQHGSAHAELSAATDVVVGKLIHSFAATLAFPDLLQAEIDNWPLKSIRASEFPHGIEVVEVYLLTSASSSYSLNVENWDDFDTINGVTPTIDAIATSTSTETTEDTITEGTVAAGQIIMLDLDTDDIGWIYVEVQYYEPIA